MDIEYTQDLDYSIDNFNREPFTFLKDFDEHLEALNLDFIYPYNSQIINFREFGSILVIINEDEILNIKFTVNTDPCDKSPLKIKKSTKFSSIQGRDIISDKLYTYIHDKNGDLYKFRSSQSLDKIRHDNVLHLQCFNFLDTRCFVMISKVNSKVVLYLYDKSFDKDYSGYQRCVDLILPEDSIQTLENEFTYEKINENFTFATEMLHNITENILETEFFNCFLGTNVTNENIRDILLVSMNDRLFFVKYRGVFTDENAEMGESSNDLVSIETVLISRGKIIAIKYLDSSLIILDDLWVLTIFYQCTATNVIKRREIPLGDDISCFRFTSNYLVYSNRHKIIFMKFKIAPAEPELFEVNLNLVATFSVAQNGEFLLAIDRNKFFYYVSVPNFTNQPNSEEMDEIYTTVTDRDIKKFPDIVNYLENVEQEFKELSETIEHESDMLLLLTYLDENENVTAGHAKIKYLPFLTPSQDDDIICDPVNSQFGAYIRIVVAMEPIFSAFKLTISFYRHTQNKGVLLQHIEVNPRKDKTKFAIYVPDEIDDCSENKVELFAQFHVNKSGDCHVLEFPFIIDAIKVSSGYPKSKNAEIDKCIKAINKLLQDEK